MRIELDQARRTFLRRALRGSCAALVAAALPRFSWATGEVPAARRLVLLNTHTLERLDIVYQEQGAYVPEALAALDHLLRDHLTGDVYPIDPAVLDEAADLAQAVGHPNDAIEIISGFRSPATNEMLRQRGPGVAKHSLHLEGRALDLRLPGVDLARLHDAALAQARGGVGYYPSSNFIHIDSGRVRRW